jgi:hypothetical protein
MAMERKLITLALVKLGEEEPTTRDKWLTIDRRCLEEDERS